MHEPVIVQPVGRRTVNPVTVNWLVLGFVIVSVTVVGFPPGTGFPLLVVMVGRDAFEARTGDVKGITNRNPDNTRSAKIIPELIFVTYAFESVYNIFGCSCRATLYKADEQMVYFWSMGDF